MKTSDPAGPGASHWPLVLLASAVLMITMGVRQSLGLYLSPLNTATGLGVASISFAMAVGQFMWGAAQPVFGAVADRYGPARALFTGAVMLVAGLAQATGRRAWLDATGCDRPCPGTATRDTGGAVRTGLTGLSPSAVTSSRGTDESGFAARRRSMPSKSTIPLRLSLTGCADFVAT